MTEDCRLSVFIHRDNVLDITGNPSNQRIVFVSDENNHDMLEDFESCSTSIFNDFQAMKTSEIIANCERRMFDKISKILCNHLL